MSKQRISKIARKIVLENNTTSVSYGDLNLLHDIFDESGIKLRIDHPLNVHRAILNSLDRESKEKDAIFEKQYFRSFKGLARTFKLKKKSKYDLITE